MTAARVMLVDDDPDIRLMLSMRLSADERFVVVSEARDGQEAINLAEDACPDMIILDLNMPVLDGIHTLPLIKRVCPAAKVVIFSAVAGLASTSLTERGADLVIDKGDQIGGVIEALARLMPSAD